MQLTLKSGHVLGERRLLVLEPLLSCPPFLQHLAEPRLRRIGLLEQPVASHRQLNLVAMDGFQLRLLCGQLLAETPELCLVRCLPDLGFMRDGFHAMLERFVVGFQLLAVLLERLELGQPPPRLVELGFKPLSLGSCLGPIVLRIELESPDARIQPGALLFPLLSRRIRLLQSVPS